MNLIESMEGKSQTTEQFYIWSGGVVQHGSNSNYNVSWLDSKASSLRGVMQNSEHPGFCNEISVFDYQGYTEPTQLTNNRQTEDCVSFVFVPHSNSRGQICLADDYCSTVMSYICELSNSNIFLDFVYVFSCS